MAVRCYVLLEINDGFFFDRPLSRAHVNKYKGQQIATERGGKQEALTWRLCIELKGNKGNNVKRI